MDPGGDLRDLVRVSGASSGPVELRDRIVRESGVSEENAADEREIRLVAVEALEEREACFRAT